MKHGKTLLFIMIFLILCILTVRGEAPPAAAFGPVTPAVSAGWAHTLFLKSDGTVWSCGQNDKGQLGLGFKNDASNSMPTQVKGPNGNDVLTGVKAIGAGWAHSVALRVDGSVWAWGDNWFNQLGDGSSTGRYVPVRVKGPEGVGYLSDVASISTGGYHTLALMPDGTVWAWGRNQYGQLGDGTNRNRYTPVQVRGPGGVGYLTDVVAVAAGGYHSAALTADGTVYTWGLNQYGALGTGITGDQHAPVPVRTAQGEVLQGIKAISAGSFHTVALHNNGTVWAWGKNEYGRLGDGTTNDSFSPVQAKNSDGTAFLSNIIAISAGGDHTVALQDNGVLWTWGYNWGGQLGDGTTYHRHLPVPVKNDSGGNFSGVVSFSAGGIHTATVRSDGRYWLWGRNIYGQLGNGSTVDRRLPVYALFSLPRLKGATRYETAVEICRSGWERSSVIILARGDEFADAMAGVPLAFILDAPVLLTPPDRLDGAAKQEILRLGATEAVILGGSGAISAQVEDELRHLGLTVNRLQGTDRFETASQIASAIAPQGTDTIVLAFGRDFPDALSVAAYAAQLGYPILLTDTFVLPAATLEALQNLGVNRVIVVGGTGVISETVYDQLPGANRVAGKNRYDTVVKLGEYFQPQTHHMYVATGLDFADAITGAVLAAKHGTSILLVSNHVPAEIRQYLENPQTGITQLTIFGGSGAVSDQVMLELQDIIQ